MTQVVGIVFSPGGKVYSFDPGDLELGWSDKVICQTARGREYGRVVEANHEVPQEELAGALKRVMRRATDADAEIVERQREEAQASIKVFREIKERLDVDLSPVRAEIVFDASRIVFSYKSEGRPNVSSLQRELAKEFDRQVELRGVGPREQARLCGGHGLCGGQMCCTRFPSHKDPIALRMAKDQDLPMSSGRITGLCGRLRCCLAFEHPTYKSFRDRAPRVGARVDTPQGPGIVKSYEVIKDSCVVELEGGSQDSRSSRGLEVVIDECRELAEGEEPATRRELTASAEQDAEGETQPAEEKKDQPAKSGRRRRRRRRRRKKSD